MGSVKIGLNIVFRKRERKTSRVRPSRGRSEDRDLLIGEVDDAILICSCLRCFI